MIVRKYIDFDKWEMDQVYNYDIKVFDKVSKKAAVLYHSFLGIGNGGYITDVKLREGFNMSQRTLAKYKRELKNAGLILIDKLDNKIPVIYIGSSKENAEKTKTQWEEIDE